MLEENRRMVEKAKRRLALELQRKEEELYCELELIQRQKEEAAKENTFSGSLAEASSPSSNNVRNKRPSVWMRDYTIGEDFCEEDDEAVWMRDYAIGEIFCKEDDEAHSAMFTTTRPVNFEDTLI